MIVMGAMGQPIQKVSEEDHLIFKLASSTLEDICCWRA
jgi:hypothetical protein